MSEESQDRAARGRREDSSLSKEPGRLVGWFVFQDVGHFSCPFLPFLELTLPLKSLITCHRYG